MLIGAGFATSSDFAFEAALAAFDVDAVVGKHRKDMRRRQLVADVEDHLGALHTWPQREQRLVLGACAARRGDVFRFVLFTLGNRAPPRPVIAMLNGLGLLPTMKSRRDCWDAVRCFRDGKLCKDAFYWDMDAKAFVRINGPSSWCAGGVPLGMRGVGAPGAKTAVRHERGAFPLLHPKARALAQQAARARGQSRTRKRR